MATPQSKADISPPTSELSSTGPSEKPSDQDNRDSEERVFPTGWRLHLLTFALCLSLLLSTLETTIVSTALVSIANALKHFEQSGWVVTAYLLAYTGFLIIYAKFSDVLGRKPMILLALLIFTVFSIVCGVAQTMVQLIICRALQGFGASGIYSMVMVIAPDMVPYEKMGPYMGIISSVFAIASILGPIVGGAIIDHSTWRWVFWLNGPAGAFAIVLISAALPSNFPYGKESSRKQGLGEIFSKKNSQRLDWIGAFLSLAASILLVFPLQQAGTKYAWNSAPVISTFILSGVLWTAFIAWERWLSFSKSKQEPVLPWWLVKDRMFVGMLLNAFFTGFPFMAAIVNLPQRFQAVNGTSASGAGVRLLPLLLCSPFASALSGFVITRLKVPPLYLIFTGGALQLIGIGLMSSIPESRRDILIAQYGYEVIMGFGFGLGLSTLLVMVPLVIANKRDTAVAMGAITQIRVLGGTIGLAICTALQNNHVKSGLRAFLTEPQISSILDSTAAISLLDTDTQNEVRRVFAGGYNLQMKIMTAFSAAVFLTSLIMLERKPRRSA
ncbi:major facilitator superfamily transporter [Sphaerosporella brunnea]|uniref:Major facilitator superfamily transporter n=1 Tax=Sphaerosporella brunnea TaxID=1250544 RepID=A0A5J5EWX0_9PEZI|nr:major facilitator superfamily transporter [Sphaerosporella brunnea]